MKDDEYIDLDKIRETPQNGEVPAGLPKEERENTDKKEEIKEKDMKSVGATKKAAKKKKKVAKKKSKTAPAKKVKKTSSNNKTLIYLLLGLIILAIIVILIASMLRTEEDTREDRVLLLINGEPLHSDEVRTRADWLRLVNGVPITDEQALELSIDIELLAQEATRRGISTDDGEVQEVFDEMSRSSGLNEAELKEYIEGFGIDYSVLRKIIKKEITARKVAEQITTQIEPTEEELLQYYEENKHLFVHDELAKIRHIQINYNNQSDEETYAKALNIKNQINENKTNFCELVEEYSDDWNTADICGEYVLEAQMTYEDELSEASFEMEDDEIRIVKTMAGYHVLWKVETIPPGISSFEDIREVLKMRLTTSSIEERYLAFLDELKENATIEDYTGTVDEITEEPLVINLTDLIEGAENATEDVVEDAQDLIDEIEQEITEIIEEIEPIVEDTQEADEELQEQQVIEQQTIITEDKKQLRLAKCLTENDAKMYTVYWSPHSMQQKEAFGEYAEHLIIIECDPDGVNPKVTECMNTLKKEYPTWPTWQINGELHEGYQNLHTLAQISGCPY